MEKYTPTITWLFDNRVEKKTGKFPVKLVVYCKPEKKRYKTNIDLTEEQWKKLNSDKLRDESLKEIRFKMNALRTKATKILEDLIPFSFQRFEEAFYQNAIDLKSLNLTKMFERYIEIHNNKGSVGTASSYQSTINSLNDFRKDLSLYDITSNFLQEYEEDMLGKGKSVTTIAIYLRQLRAIYNDAISRNLINKDNYPFGKNRYKIPASKNIKKALSFEEIKLLLNDHPEKAEEQKALDFWILSYLCNGMNFCDILRLKPENYTGSRIIYIRSKTKNTKKGSRQEIRVAVPEKAFLIIEKWKSKSVNSHYIFPFLKEELSPIQQKYFIQDFIKKTNKSMEAIRVRLGISQKCTTYSCRHSFATVMKRKNVSTEFISESLGHSSVLTTSAYLDSFEDKTKQEFSKLLTDF